jgi:uridine kinase
MDFLIRERIKMIIVLISGGSASGKTTFAKLLNKSLKNSVLLSQDHYYKDVSHLKQSEIETYDFDHPDAVLLDKLIDNIIELDEKNITYSPFYNFNDGSVIDNHTKITKPDFLIIEGIFSLHKKELRDLSHVSFFINVDADIRLSRRILRDIKERGDNVETIINRYLSFVKPCHDNFIQKQIEYADLIIDGNSFFNSDLIELSCNQIKSFSAK